MSESLVATVIWDGGALPLRELAALSRTDFGWVLRGTVVGVLDRVRFSARYEVKCTPAWETTDAWVELARPPAVREVRLAVSPGFRWTVGGTERPDLDGVRDVDIQFTPVTNTLPIRRAALGVGEEANVVAAWVRFPDLDVSLLPQTYRRIGDTDYEYRSGEFRAEIRVDEEGMVETYGDFWRRLHA